VGVAGADEVAADVRPAPQVVDPVQAAQRLVDGVEVRGQQDLAALGQGIGQGTGVGVDRDAQLVGEDLQRPGRGDRCATAAPIRIHSSARRTSMGVLARGEQLTEDFLQRADVRNVTADDSAMTRSECWSTWQSWLPTALPRSPVSRC
jgi:hypothetical protein